MKQLNNYIVEKLKLDKNIKITERLPFKEALDNMIQSMKQSNKELEWYRIEEETPGMLFVYTNNSVRIYYSQIKKYIFKYFENKYNITNILWNLSEAKLIINYEED